MMQSSKRTIFFIDGFKRLPCYEKFAAETKDFT